MSKPITTKEVNDKLNKWTAKYVGVTLCALGFYSRDDIGAGKWTMDNATCRESFWEHWLSKNDKINKSVTGLATGGIWVYIRNDNDVPDYLFEGIGKTTKIAEQQILIRIMNDETGFH